MLTLLVRIVAAAGLVGACSREVPLSTLWSSDLSVGGPGKSVVTAGVLESVSAEADSCSAELVDGTTKVQVTGRGAVCERFRSASGKRMVVEGTAALGCREPDMALRPDGGGGPLLNIDVAQLNPAR